MNTMTALLLGLGLGLVLGALPAWALLRPALLRANSTNPSEETVQRLLALADERYTRDTADRDERARARDAQLNATLAPITSTLQQMERSLQATNRARAEADGALQQHLRMLGARTEQLSADTNALVTALKAPTARGRWGEMQLRRLVEAAGMLDHVDFQEQLRGARADGDAAQIPDLVVHLAGDRHLAVDAKAPMDAYFAAAEAPDATTAARFRKDHASAMRRHVKALSAKGYWAGLGNSPEMTVMFVPSDGVLAEALAADPALLDHSFNAGIVIASPATLMALLRTVAHTWRTEALNQEALKVLSAGRELHSRLGTMAAHLVKLGRSLDGSVQAFNSTVGSFESRVMPAVRRFEEMNAGTSTALAEVQPLTQRTRPVSIAEGDMRSLPTAEE